MITVNIQAIRDNAPYRPVGYVEEVLSAGTIDGDYVTIQSDAFDALTVKYGGYLRPCGPGCQLKRLLASAGIHGHPGCKCDARAAVMDAWGPDECGKPEQFAQIVGWLAEEAAIRGVPFVEAAARLVVMRAIANARRHAKKLAKQAASC